MKILKVLLVLAVLVAVGVLLAMWLYGNPDNISSFNANPDRNLTTFTGAWADYIKSYLFALYFYERYGGQPAIQALGCQMPVAGS